MCKHAVLIPMKATDSAMQKKTWKPAVCRVWRAIQRALNLEHCPASHFATCQWQTVQRPTTYYLVYRWFLFLSLVSIGVASFACQSLPRHYKGPMKELNYWKWFIYFTNWGYLTIIVQSGLAVAVVHRYRAEKSLSISSDDDDNLTPSSRRPRTPFICRVYWLAQIIATDLAFVITLVYWSLVHNPEIHEVNTLNLLVHGGNSIIMLCELAVTSHPIRLAHALYGASAGLAYGIFSALYWALGGTDRTGLQAIYPTLDWNKPGVALGFVSMCAVVMVCAHAFATGLVALRIRIAARLRRSRLHLDKLTLPTH